MSSLHRKGWACLMYHDTPALDSTDYFSVTGVALKEQLDLCARLSLRARSLESILQDAEAGAGNEQSVAITFDDAYRSNYEVALPVLSAQGATATVFVVTSWVGTSRYCTWTELAALRDAGWSIQSHTHTHPFLSQLNEDQVRTELTTSRNELEQHLGSPVLTLALPNGDFPQARFRRLLRESGYRWIATSRWGPNGAGQVSAREIRRYTVRRSTTIDRFAQLASASSGAYSREGLRLSLLNRVRQALGPTLYRSLRASALRTLNS